jgi:hypothetical protein
MKRALIALLPFALFAQMSNAADYGGAMQTYLDTSIRTWAEDPALVSAINAANAERAGFDQAKIDAMDTAWRAEVGTADGPTITPILHNAAADFLRTQVDASAGKVTEAFITDNLGLNVAVSSETSDMWQGDEDKFSKVFPAGPAGTFMGDVEMDESTQTYQGQISIAITDPASGAVIGTLTVGVNADSLM